MKRKNYLIKDSGIIALSIVVAVLLVKTGVLREILNQSRAWWFLESFLAGMFFTTVFTVVPATMALAEIACSTQPVLLVAFFGGLGALLGDLVIFRFMKDRLTNDLFYLIRGSKGKKFRSIFQLRLSKWLTFFVGALIIASPLPDEIGLLMMGLSQTKTSLFIPLSFAFNSLGILVIGLIAKNLL